MFEALVTICALAGAPCRDALLPGYESGDAAECHAALVADPPVIEIPGLASGDPFCAPQPDPLPFTEVAPGIWVHRGAVEGPAPWNAGDVSNIVIVTGADHAAVIDSGGSRVVGEGVWRALRRITDLPLSHMILTHMHPDHVFGASVLAGAGAEVLGHARLPRALADRAESYRTAFATSIGKAFLGSEVPRIDRAVAEPLTLDLGGRVLTLTPVATAHTVADLAVSDSASGILIAGDLLFDDHIPALDGSLRGWQAVMADLIGQPFTGVVPGHGGPLLPWPEGAGAQADYLNLLAEDTKAALYAGRSIGEAAPEIAQGAAGDWALFDAFNTRNATAAYAELEWE